jgi:hypothetical protein
VTRAASRIAESREEALSMEVLCQKRRGGRAVEYELQVNADEMDEGGIKKEENRLAVYWMLEHSPKSGTWRSRLGAGIMPLMIYAFAEGESPLFIGVRGFRAGRHPRIAPAR